MQASTVLALWFIAACTPKPPPGPGDRIGDDDAWLRTFGSAKLDEGWGIDLYDGDLFVSTHMANPTGRVLSADEQIALENYEDAGGDAADLGL